jgi:hypothetical protein
LERLTKALDDAHTVRARFGDGGGSDVIDPDDIDKLRDPAKRVAALRVDHRHRRVNYSRARDAGRWRPSHLWLPSRIDIRFLGQHS